MRQEIEIKELKEQLQEMDATLQETKESAAALQEKEASLREKYDDLRLTSRTKITKLQVCKSFEPVLKIVAI